MTIFRQIAIARATLVAFAGMGAMWGAYAALVPDIKAMLGVGDAWFGTLLLATPVAAVVTMLFAPRIAPTFGRHVLPLSILAFGLAYLLPGWIAVPPLFAASMVLVGVTNAFLDVTMNARVSALELDRGAHLMNLNHAAYSFGYAGAAILTGWLRLSGWAPGEILTALALAVAVSAALAFEGGQDINGFAREAGVRVRLGRVPLWGGIITLVAFMSENAAENWSALHIERTLGAARGEGSFGPAVMALTMGVGRMLGQIAVAHVDEGRLLRAGTLVCAAGLALVGLAPSPFAAYLGLVVTGLGGSVIAPTAFAVVGRLADPAVRAQSIARATALGYLGYFFGPPALGLISELLSLRVALVTMAAVVLVVLALYPRLVAAGRGRAATTGAAGTAV